MKKNLIQATLKIIIQEVDSQKPWELFCLSEGDGSVMYIFKTQDVLIFYINFTKD